jgi:hypothetical protein
MSIAASAENTMKILKVKTNDDNFDNSDSKCHDNNNSKFKDKDSEKDGIIFKNIMNDSDDDMVVIILEEDIKFYKNEQNEQNTENMPGETNENEKECENTDNGGDVRVNIDTQQQEQEQEQQEQEQEQEQQEQEQQEQNVNVLKVVAPKQKYIGVEVYTHLQQTLESQKMYPLLPCNMISSFARVMEYVEYFDIPSEERKKLVVDLVKILAYSNNDYGSRECFEYFVEHNMIDDIIKTIIESTKNQYDINRFPHTNRKIVLSCVSLSKKIKIVKPSAKIESLFEELKINLCGLKRFFKMKEKEDSKQT